MAYNSLRDIIGMIMPLFEKKLEFLKQMQERQLSSQENIEFAKINQKQSELEAKIKGDKDQLSWEKEKFKMGMDHGFTIETLKANNAIDIEKMKQGGEAYKADVVAEVAKRGQDISVFNQALQSSGTRTNPDTGITESNPFAAGLVPTIANRTGLGPNPVADDVLRQHSAALADRQRTGGDAAVEGYLRNLSQTNPDAYAALRAGNVAPAAPTVAAPADAPAVAAQQPIITGRTEQNQVAPPAIRQRPTQTQPVSIGSMNGGASRQIDHRKVFERNPVETTGIFQRAGAGVRSVLNAQDTLRENVGEAVTQFPRRAVVGAGIAGNAVAGAGREFMTGYNAEAAKREEKRRALRRAQVMTGF
jgi:hypothetical protein